VWGLFVCSFGLLPTSKASAGNRAALPKQRFAFSCPCAQCAFLLVFHKKPCGMRYNLFNIPALMEKGKFFYFFA
jgi:hypothetical protein